MTARNSLDERINKIDLKTKLLMAQARMLKAKKAEQDRKERTRRLIQIGAMVENVLGHKVEDFNKFKEFLQKSLLEK